MGYEIRLICTYRWTVDTEKQSYFFQNKINLFVSLGPWKCVLCRVLKWNDIIKKRGSDHCSCHHNTSRDCFEICIKVTLSRDLCRDDSCSDHCRVFMISLHLRTRQRTHFQCPDNTNKFILFWEKLIIIGSIIIV